MPEELLDSGNALGMLRAEHERIRAMLGEVFERDAAFAKEALIRVVEELKIHNAMERMYFYPLCEQHIHIVTPERLQMGTADSMAMEELVTRIEGMDVTDATFRPTLEKLIHSFQRHCFAVEENLFISLEGGDWQMHNWLVECAINMRALREQMLQSMRRPRSAENPTFQDMQHRRAQEMGRGVYPPRDVVSNEQRRSESGEDISMSTEGDIIDMGGKTMDIDREEGTAGR